MEFEMIVARAVVTILLSPFRNVTLHSYKSLSDGFIVAINSVKLFENFACNTWWDSDALVNTKPFLLSQISMFINGTETDNSSKLSFASVLTLHLYIALLPRRTSTTSWLAVMYPQATKPKR